MGLTGILFHLYCLVWGYISLTSSCRGRGGKKEEINGLLNTLILYFALNVGKEGTNKQGEKQDKMDDG